MKCSLLLPLLMACGTQSGPPTICSTQCGLRLIGPVPPPEASTDLPWTCEGLQVLEDLMLVEFTRIDDDRFFNTCNVLHNWSFSINDTMNFHDSLGRYVGGVTYCDDWGSGAHSEIGNLPPDESTLPHEMAHVIQGCQSTGCAHPGTDDSAHRCWTDTGVYAAINAVNEKAYSELRYGP